MHRQLILIIDQSAETRSMYGDYFRHHDYAVMEAADAAQGVRLCAVRTPDLIVTELSDEPTWVGAIRLLRQRDTGPATKTIVCSTRIDPLMPYVPHYLDADVALPKPTSPNRLLLEARQLLARAATGGRPVEDVA